MNRKQIQDKVESVSLSTLLFATFLWLLAGLGLGFFSVDLATAFVYGNVVILLILLWSAKTRHNAPPTDSQYPRLTPVRAILAIVFILGWVLALQLLLSLLRVQSTSLILGFWGGWVVLLMLIVRFVEKKWRKTA